METMGIEDKEYLQLLGNRVRDFRKAMGLTQEKLAELAGISPTYVSNIEIGKYNVTVCVIKRISASLHVPAAQLFDFNSGKVERDELIKTVVEIKSLNSKEQKLILETIKGMLAGIKE